MFQAIKMLNHFPVKRGIYDTIIPTTIMTGKNLHCKKHLGLHIGQYFQVNEEDTPCNSNQPRTKCAIFMGPSGNIQGGFMFMNLSTMKKITKRYWDIIPIPNTIIYRVNLLGIYQQDILVFIDCRGQIIGDGYFELT